MDGMPKERQCNAVSGYLVVIFNSASLLINLYSSPPDGRMAALLVERGKSGLHGNTVPGNTRRGRPQG